MSKMKTYMVETQVSSRYVDWFVLYVARAEQVAIDTMNYDDLDYDTARVHCVSRGATGDEMRRGIVRLNTLNPSTSVRGHLRVV